MGSQVQEVSMLYELALMLKPEIDDKEFDSIKEMVHEVVKFHDGDVFVEDDWGRIHLAMPTEKGTSNARFLYYVYSSKKEGHNTELVRRLRINESVLRWLIVKVAKNEEDAGKFVKNLKIPFSKRYGGSVIDGVGNGNLAKEIKQFSKRRNCWFTVSNIRADWKDPQTFSWLLNEFGKISPARSFGISRKHQNIATQAIKRARQMGFASYLSNQLAQQQ